MGEEVGGKMNASMVAYEEGVIDKPPSCGQSLFDAAPLTDPVLASKDSGRPMGRA